MGVTEVVPNFIDGSWRTSSDPTALSVTNPATAEEIARVPLTTSMEVEAAALSAAAAFPKWRRTPCGERVQYLGTPTSLFSKPFRRVLSPVSWAAVWIPECRRARASHLKARTGLEL